MSISASKFAATPSHICVTTTPLLISVDARPAECLEAVITDMNARQIFIGDTVVLWRALILWRQNRAVQAISAALILATLSESNLGLTEAVHSYYTCRYIHRKPRDHM